MDSLTIFGVQLILSLTVFGLLAKWHVAPWLARKPIRHALIVLTFPHALRHIGLAFLVPSLTAETLPGHFAFAAAYGDFVSGLLALLVLVALRRHWSWALPVAWLFNIVGTLDLANRGGAKFQCVNCSVSARNCSFHPALCLFPLRLSVEG